MVTIGAVAYDPKVVTIWEGFVAFFARHGLATDYVLYSNYERQVDGLVAGEVDVAWNSPLAWVESERRAARAGLEAHGFAMRDTDQDLTSVVLVRADGGPSTLAELDGQKVAVGASDSPQATLIPLGALREAGIAVEPVPHEIMVGKHGDHVGGERDAVKALLRGEVAAACCIDVNELAFARDGTIPAGATKVLVRSPKYDHCLFTGIVGRQDAAVSRLRELLLGMSWEDPAVRPLLELEGLREWRPGRTTGFRALTSAVDGLAFAGAAAVREYVARK